MIVIIIIIINILCNTFVREIRVWFEVMYKKKSILLILLNIQEFSNNTNLEILKYICYFSTFATGSLLFVIFH